MSQLTSNPYQVRCRIRRQPRITVLLLVAVIAVTGCSPSSPATRTPAATPTAPATASATAPSTAAPTIVLPTPTPAPAATATPSPEPTPSAWDPAKTPLVLEPVVSGLTRPLFLTHAGDGSGRLFILEKPGRIRIVQDGVLLPDPFLDITDRVGSQANEQGLLGLAFDPSYPSNGRFFVNYTNADGDTVISRFAVGENPNRADPASEVLVLTIDQPAPNHNGGMLAFGPDGMLWIGTGDGGGAGDRLGNGQNPATLLGKMLRIDVSPAGSAAAPYTIPADNPWVTADWNGRDVRDEIWAIGLRNPWRYSFDRVTGDLWIADVGQEQYEEVNLTPAGSAGGLNFGWPIMEGLHCFASVNCDATGLTLPVAEYQHSGQCSITGGYAYRGTSWPELNGVYLYADYCTGEVWGLTPAADGGLKSQTALQTGTYITSFGEDESGELYVIDDGGTVSRVTAP